MKKIFFSLSALLLFGIAFADVQIESVYFSDAASEKLHSVEYLITQTPLTQRIQEDELAGGELDYWVNPFRNIQRMLRSISVGANSPTKTIEWLNSYMDKKLEILNETGKIAVYGFSKQRMNFFLENSAFYWGGRK